MREKTASNMEGTPGRADRQEWNHCRDKATIGSHLREGARILRPAIGHRSYASENPGVRGRAPGGSLAGGLWVVPQRNRPCETYNFNPQILPRTRNILESDRKVSSTM